MANEVQRIDAGVLIPGAGSPRQHCSVVLKGGLVDWVGPTDKVPVRADEALTTTIPVLVLFEKDQRADSAILFVNNADTTVRFNAAGIVGSNNLRIVRTEPPSDWDDPNLPLTLNPGASLRVFVAYSGNEEKIDSATLELAFPCATVALPIRVAPDRRCINVGDLDFGRVQAGASKTLALEVCNQGEGNVRFTDSSASGGGSFLSWIDDAFDVPTATIDLLKRVTLGPGNCVTINVTFTAGSDPEAHRSVARFWLDTRQCRDTSIWQAVVVDSTLSVSRTLSTSAHLDLTSAQLDADGTLAFALQSELHGDMRVALFDLQGNRVATPYAGAVESGEHQLRMPLPALPSGSYIIEITLAGERVARRLMLIR